MMEFNKYSDGCVCFEERELILVAKYISNTTELFKYALNNNMSFDEMFSLMNGACKIVKAAEMWREECDNEMKEVDENEHGDCSNG